MDLHPPAACFIKCLQALIKGISCVDWNYDLICRKIHAMSPTDNRMCSLLYEDGGVEETIPILTFIFLLITFALDMQEVVGYV